MVDILRWGILGPGRIAGKFATSMAHVTDAEIVAVGSRSQERADAFAERFSIPHRHASYEALVADSDVDVVYVATPHSHHKAGSLLALEAGKPVLCEKPFAINAAEAESMVACARQKKLFLMEGMWTRFFPTIVKLRERLQAGAIGEPLMVTADFGFRADIDPKRRLFNPELGGGALLDVGIYPVAFASMIFGRPARIESMAVLGETGVDERAGMLFGYGGGQMAVLHTAVRTQTVIEAAVMGSDGMIRVHHPMFKPHTLSLTSQGETEAFTMPYEPEGFQYEAAEVGACLRQGRCESAIMPLDESLDIMKTLDRLRAQWGLRYPME